MESLILNRWVYCNSFHKKQDKTDVISKDLKFMKQKYTFYSPNVKFGFIKKGHSETYIQ